MRHLEWHPASISSLETLDPNVVGPFIVCFSGEAGVASRIEAWKASLEVPILHLTTFAENGGCDIRDFDMDKLQSYCVKAFAVNRHRLSVERQKFVERFLPKWRKPVDVEVNANLLGHNVVVPNGLSALRAERVPTQNEGFVAASESDYTQLISRSVDIIRDIRMGVGIKPFHIMTLTAPHLYLVEPALYRLNYKKFHDSTNTISKTTTKLLRFYQRQRGFRDFIDPELLEQISSDAQAQGLFMERREELDTFTLAVGLRAAETTSAVMRLSPAINHAFNELSSYARNVRSEDIPARLKTPRLFEAVQSKLKAAIGEDRIKFLEEQTGAVKIISDAPVELLPMDGITLGLALDCARICATPGNLLVGLLTNVQTLTFEADDLLDVLLVTSFKEDDKLRHVMARAVTSTAAHYKSLRIKQVYVSSVEEFTDALNAFEGNILIFDGHGSNNDNQPIGNIILSGMPIDVWELRGKVRCPPIVLLSACDTHGFDAISHATVGNGFLALGARSVLATSLPVGGIQSAVYMSRLLIRLAVYIPAHFKAHGTAVSWLQVISGMIRMWFASDVLDDLIGRSVDFQRERILLQNETNNDINVGRPDWYHRMLDALSKVMKIDRADVERKAKAAMSRSEAIRYVHLGSPETMIISADSIRKSARAFYERWDDRWSVEDYNEQST
ncbi:CHAT domain-containing protein [Rhizobium leguminosarum]|uniref:CHAT domain-containing protein n=1 Tax=Rhizobium leguminosarum TaxID=384 RepID=UPI00102FCF3C|nr:CHAT domain-containing protein [Rhizobium leguminosarum]TBF65688.1 hypothetical protein ELG89_34615 [Rhizobium leguminosarum]